MAMSRERKQALDVAKDNLIKAIGAARSVRDEEERTGKGDMQSVRIAARRKCDRSIQQAEAVYGRAVEDINRRWPT